MHVGQCTAPQVLALLDPLHLSQQALEGATPVVEGAEVSRARIQWKQRFTSSADTRTAHFPKDGDIFIGVHGIVSSFLAKFLSSFDC